MQVVLCGARCEGYRNRGHLEKFKAALIRDGVYVLRSNVCLKSEEFWQMYTQLTVVEHAFRVLKSDLLLLTPAYEHAATKRLFQ